LKKLFAIFFLLHVLHSGAHTNEVPDPGRTELLSGSPVKKSFGAQKRQWFIGGLSAGLYAGSLVALNKAWYKNYPKTSFHTFNDAAEWKQVDKIGHAWSAYNLSRASTAAWRWAGQDNKNAVLIGSLSGFSYLTVIEILDAHSANWGWSWPDIAANTFGTSLFAAQEIGWSEQKISFKFSAHRKRYSASLNERTSELYGASLPEKILKDYNGQTYWFSANIRAFFPETNLPSWLSVAIGYGAEGMFGGFDNVAYDKNGNIIFDRRDIKRYRQWYLAPDIDLTRIKSNSRFVKTAFSILNAIKIPAPALEFSQNKFHFRTIQF
jgi:hypothetical protein